MLVVVVVAATVVDASVAVAAVVVVAVGFSLSNILGLVPSPGPPRPGEMALGETKPSSSLPRRRSQMTHYDSLTLTKF